MIITLKGANFSLSNIGTLTTWSIKTTLGTGATSSSDVTSVSRTENTGYSTTITLDDGYTLGTVSVTMGGTDITSTAFDSSANTITIDSVTGNVVIKVPTVNTSTGEEDEGGNDESGDNSGETTGETDITSLFDFTMYPTRVCNVTTSGVSPRQQSSSFFDSAVADISAYAGKTIKIMIPKYTSSAGTKSMNATYLTSSATVEDSTTPGVFTEMLQLWELSDNGAKTGAMAEYTLTLPSNAQYLYTSIFNSAAIDQGIGDDTFYCKVVN